MYEGLDMYLEFFRCARCAGGLVQRTKTNATGSVSKFVGCKNWKKPGDCSFTCNWSDIKAVILSDVVEV